MESRKKSKIQSRRRKFNIVPNSIFQLEDDKKFLKEKIISLTSDLTKLQTCVVQLETQLKLETLKYKIYRNLIEQNLNLKLDNIVVDMYPNQQLLDDSKLLSTQDPMISILNTKEVSRSHSPNEENKPSSPRQNEVYRKVRVSKKIQPQPIQTEHINDVKTQMIQEEHENFHMSESQCYQVIKESIGQLETSRNYTNLLKTIKEARFELLRFI